MNFSTECISDLLLYRKALQEDRMLLDVASIDITIKSLIEAKKFLVPPPGRMNVVARKSAFKFMRLPYPICAFEYSCPEARDEGIKGANIDTSRSTRRIALAYDCRKDVGPIPALKANGMIPKDSTGILVQSIYYIDATKMWAASFGGGYTDEQLLGEHEFFLDNVKLNFQLDAVPLMYQSIHRHFGHLSRQNIVITMLNDIADEVGMTMRACLMLNTRNLKVVKAVEAPAALNKKRAKTGKPPFFDYYTLDVFVSEQGSRLFRKRVDPNFVRTLFAGIRAERRWGTVTGHFKTRATGIFWWNDYAYGNKAKGIVEKEYNVKAKK